MFSFRSVIPTLLASVFFPIGSQGGPPCGGPRSQGVCARWIRPYSDNAYAWDTGLGVTGVDLNALMADDTERYDSIYGCSSPGLYTATCCTRYVYAVGVDCDGPETDLPMPFDPQWALPFGWSVADYCAIDNAERVFAYPTVYYLPNNSPYVCTTLCESKGYKFAGVEYGNECYCGGGYANGIVPTSANVSECNMRCSGIYDYLCGGSWRMQIYTRS